MDKPEMIFFDYGHTLCYEPVQDYPAGWAEVMRHAVRNPQGVTAALARRAHDGHIQPRMGLHAPP